MANKKDVSLLLLCAPLSILTTMAVGSVVCQGWFGPWWSREMFVAGMVSLATGIIAILPLIQGIMQNNDEKLAQKALLAVFFRPILALFGTFLVSAPGFGLTRFAVICWMLAYYFPLLATETAITARILKKLDKNRTPEKITLKDGLP